MDIERVTTVLPVDDLAAAVAQWSRLLGVDPTFVDGDRWAQFDVAGSRFALAGTDRTGDEATLMLKVGDLEQAITAARSSGLEPGPVEQGPHEQRCVVNGAGGVSAVLYSPLAAS
jgi:hypothetical protein